MEYTEKLSTLQVQAYLRKLEIREPVRTDLRDLNILLLAQLTHIPFDSLDVWATGACPSLSLDDLYHKIIENHRGGYCFELNTLFRSLLNSLGFAAYQAIAYILNPDGTQQPPAHNVILCELSGKKYFCDVGYGGPVPYVALELKEGIQDGFQLSKCLDTWYVYRVMDSGTRPLTAFRDVPAAINDLIPLNYYISQRPDIHFRHVIHLSRRNLDGSIFSIDGKEFKTHTREGTKTQQLNTIDDLKIVIRDYFDMDPESIPLREAL